MRPILFISLATAAACAPSRATTSSATPASAAAAPSAVDVRLETDEADAALAIVRAHRVGAVPTPDAWQALFTSRGYQRLKEREASMRRAFTDSSFAAFLTSDTLAARLPDLERRLADLEQIDVRAAAARAFAYLPPGSGLRARLYLEIKPLKNTFVFTGADSVPSIFLYVDPLQTAAQTENTMAHELHHIGIDAACPDWITDRPSPAQGMLLRFLGGFSEGEAMLAAAGGPDIHPHATDPDSIRRRWDRDVGNAAADMREQSAFFTAVLDGRIATADSVLNQASTYFGVQGPWYTVGWLMASTIERVYGRPALIGVLCDPVDLMTRYDDAARRLKAGGQTLPLWDPRLIARLQQLRAAARAAAR